MNVRASAAVSRCQSGNTHVRPHAAVFAVGAEILQEDVPEGHVANAVGAALRERLPHLALVDVVGRPSRDGDLEERQAECGRLPMEQRPADAVHTHALVTVVSRATTWY